MGLKQGILPVLSLLSHHTQSICRSFPFLPIGEQERNLLTRDSGCRKEREKGSKSGGEIGELGPKSLQTTFSQTHRLRHCIPLSRWSRIRMPLDVETCFKRENGLQTHVE